MNNFSTRWNLQEFNYHENKNKRVFGFVQRQQFFISENHVIDTSPIPGVILNSQLSQSEWFTSNCKHLITSLRHCHTLYLKLFYSSYVTVKCIMEVVFWIQSFCQVNRLKVFPLGSWFTFYFLNSFFWRVDGFNLDKPNIYF